MITISHNRTDGTLVYGTTKGDGAGPVLRHFRFRPSRNLPNGAYWYLPHTRDRAARSHDIDAAADALRGTGLGVVVEIDDTTPAAVSFADREAERYDRAGDRAERYRDRADNAAARGTQMQEQVRERRAQIPFGQPMMPDHHSYTADRNRRERWACTERKAAEEMERGAYLAGRAAAADAYRQHRENIPTTLRRIEALEARQRRIERHLTGNVAGDDRARYETDLHQIAGELGYWREHVAQAEAGGVKVWSKADFTKGDFVDFGYGWFEVVRVNTKSVTVPAMVLGATREVFTMQLMRAGGREGWTDTVPYSKVRGQATAQETKQRHPAAFTEPTPGGDPS